MKQPRKRNSVAVGAGAGSVYIASKTSVTHLSGRRAGGPGRKGVTGGVYVKHIGQGFVIGAATGTAHYQYRKHEYNEYNKSSSKRKK